MIRAASLSLLIIAAVSAGPAFAQDGAAVYARACVSCHEQGAVARAPSREVISALSVDRIVNALETGTMRTQGEGLTPAERRAVATFLSTDRGSASAATRACASPGAALRPGPTDWQAWGVTQANERYQRQSGITAAQVPNLKLRWAFGFDGENAAAANPTIVGDRIFVGSGSGRRRRCRLVSLGRTGRRVVGRRRLGVERRRRCRGRAIEPLRVRPAAVADR